MCFDSEIVKKKIIFTLNLLGIFKGMGLTPADSLVACVFLGMLDDANCLIFTEKDLADFIGVSNKTVIRTMAKLKNYGVAKNGYRYDFTDFIIKCDLKEPLTPLEKGGSIT